VKLWEVKDSAGDKQCTDVWMPLRFSPDGRQLLAMNADGTLGLHDVATTEKIGEVFRLPQTDAQPVAVSPDGKTLLLRNADWTFDLWDLSTQQRIENAPTFRSRQRAAAFSLDSRFLAAFHQPGITICDLVEHRIVGSKESLRDCVAFSSDGTKLAAASSNQTVRVWEALTGKDLLSIPLADIAASLAFSPDDRRLAFGGYRNTAWLCDAATGRVLFTLKGHLNAVRSVVFSPDGKTLATASTDGAVKLWHVATGQEMVARQFHEDFFIRLMFSPAGDTLVIAFLEQKTPMHLWRVPSLKAIQAAEKGPGGME